MTAFQAAYALCAVLAICVVGLFKHIENLRAERDEALVDSLRLTEKLEVADIITNTLVDDLRVAYGQPEEDVDQAVRIANSPRHGDILDLIARNEAARFDADGADWGEPA